MPTVNRNRLMTFADITNNELVTGPATGGHTRYTQFWQGSVRIGTARYVVFRNLQGGTTMGGGSASIDLTNTVLGSPRLYKVNQIRAGSFNVQGTPTSRMMVTVFGSV